MPRETIDPKQLDVLRMDSAGALNIRSIPPQSFPRLEVQWDRLAGGDVNIGLHTAAPATGTSVDLHEISVVRHMYGQNLADIGEALEALIVKHGRAVTDDEFDENDPDHVVDFDGAFLGELVLQAVEAAGAYRSWHTYLDRHGLNRLIAVLKKAGAAAFGRDQW
jgi:hypothetical protein